MENRDGNANVKYLSFTDVAESRHSKQACSTLDFCNIQAETLEKAYRSLEENGVKVGQSRMDCGSYSKEIVKTVARHSRSFYIRASRCETLRRRISEIDDSAWEDVEINYIKCQLASIPFTAFLEEEGYRLVVQRTLRDDAQPDLFDGEYVYRCILTNDTEMSNKDVVLFYNMRGGTERCFDCMNNDFGCHRHFLSILEGKGFALTKTSRVKAFVFRFASVPFKWVTMGTRRVLRLYTHNPAYLQLQV